MYLASFYFISTFQGKDGIKNILMYISMIMYKKFYNLKRCVLDYKFKSFCYLKRASIPI